jgi:hypothetical protein
LRKQDNKKEIIIEDSDSGSEEKPASESEEEVIVVQKKKKPAPKIKKEVGKKPKNLKIIFEESSDESESNEDSVIDTPPKQKN